MTYGLRATASGGQFQIDSSLNGTKHLAVHAVSNAIAGASISIGPQDILFVRGPPGSGSNAGRVQTNFSVTMSGSTMTGVVATFRYPTDYIVCKPSDSSSFTAALNASNYGIQVKNASNVVCFDSRAAVKGLEIVSVFGKNTFYGGDPQIANYNQANNLVFAGSAGTFTSGNAAYRKLYVSCFGAEFGGSPASGSNQAAYTFDYSGNKIFHEAFLSTSITGQLFLPNRSEILLGELFE